MKPGRHLALLARMAALPLVARYVRSEPIPMNATTRLGASGEFVDLRPRHHSLR